MHVKTIARLINEIENRPSFSDGGMTFKFYRITEECNTMAVFHNQDFIMHLIFDNIEPNVFDEQIRFYREKQLVGSLNISTLKLEPVDI